jgi:hypothetical protein
MERVLTRKGAIVELAIVTAGVLIALSFDGARGWMRERSLVEAARTNLTTELRANKTGIERFVATIPTRRQELATVRSIAEALLSGQPNPHRQATLEFQFADMASAAHSTAQLTGAFGLMEFEDVSTYAAIYDFQSRVAKSQNETLALLTRAISRVWIMDHAKPPLRDVELWLQDINALDAQLLLLEQFSAQLITGYEKVLARP